MAFTGKTDVFDFEDMKSVLPEANALVISVQASELKKHSSLWLVGTSPITRVKRSDIADVTSMEHLEATIIGTASENYRDVEIIGKIRIHLWNRYPIVAYVTSSTEDAPCGADGFLGHDVIRAQGWNFQRFKKSLEFKDNVVRCISLRLAKDCIPGYVEKLRDYIRETYRHKAVIGSLTVGSNRMKQLRSRLSRKLATDKRVPVIGLLEEYVDCFHLPGDKLSATNSITYPIKTKGSVTFKFPQPNFFPSHWITIENVVSDLLRQGIIKISTSPCNFVMDLTEKKPDLCGNVNYRLMVNYADLNASSEAEPFPMPGVYDVVDELYGSKYFSVLDLASAAYQIPLEPQDYYKTAFSTKSGHYEFKRMPCAIKNGPEYLQRLMTKAMKGLRDNVFVYHDDVLIYTRTFYYHETVMQKVLERYRLHGLKLNPSKCQMFTGTVLYLGNLVTDEGLQPDPAKITKLRTQPRPDDADTLRSYLGLLATHKRFIKNYASCAQPMWDLLKEPIFGWTTEAVESYEEFQAILSKKLFLAYPDRKRPFIIKTGYSKYGIWWALMQKQSKRSGLKPIIYDSRTYAPCEKSYDEDRLRQLALDCGKTAFIDYMETDLSELTQKLKIGH